MLEDKVGGFNKPVDKANNANKNTRRSGRVILLRENQTEPSHFRAAGVPAGVKRQPWNLRGSPIERMAASGLLVIDPSAQVQAPQFGSAQPAK